METTDQLINRKALEALIRHAIKNTYRTRCSDTVSEGFLQNSIALFSKDYNVSVIDNNWGELCGHYPSKIVILGHNCFGQQTPVDIGQLRESIVRSRVARCRSRFVVPVILFNGKFICRSSTLSSGPEMYSRQLYNLVLGSSNDAPAVVQSDPNNANAGMQDFLQELLNDVKSDKDGRRDWQMFSRVRNQDILLLKKFNVGFIVDLMVEKKKVKYGLNVTSSEKVDKENRYADFGIASIPFPGCEFFKEWKDNGYRTKGIAFDWTQGFVDALLELPTTPPPLSSIDWTKYKEWDIVTLTQNYLKLILNYLKHGDTGMLIHCISGWDRTPMFISLVRLSLWSEGLIHQTLAPHEILYLTIAYDWYLFGHNFPDRIYKGEDVFYFCFHFLKFITDDEFNLYPRHHHFIPHSEKQNLTKDQDLPFPLLPCSRSSTNSINSNHSNGCCDDVTDDESTVRSQETSRNIPETSSDVEDRTCPTNHDSGLTTSPLAMPIISAENEDSEESNVTPTNSTPNSSLDRADSNHNNRPIFSNDMEMPQFFVPAFQRNTEPVPVPSPVIMGMPEIRGSTPHSYGSWQMVGPNEMENYYHKSRRPSESESHNGHSNDRKMKLMAVHSLFASVFKSASEPAVPESNSVLGLSNLFESLFGNYKT